MKRKEQPLTMAEAAQRVGATVLHQIYGPYGASVDFERVTIAGVTPKRVKLADGRNVTPDSLYEEVKRS